MVAATFVEETADHAGADWVYPGVVAYRRRTIAAFAGDAGLAVTRIPWFHPLQTWYLMAADPGRLPPKEMRRFLRGPVLDPDFERSVAPPAARGQGAET